MKSINQYKCAVFDCDGVILDSNEVKTEAFSLSLVDEDAADVDYFIDYHKRNGGVSRYKKFNHYYHDYKQYPDFENRVERALGDFSKHTTKGLLECDEVPGIRAFLDVTREIGMQSYVVSGGDEEEIKNVFRQRGLEKYFTGIYGSPVDKLQHMQNLAKSGKLQNPGIYFGDARKDMEAAEQHNLDFIFIAYNSDWEDGKEVCREKKYTIKRDFTDFVI